MKLFGLTGGIGAGKTTATELLQRRGIPVIDTDRIARDVVEPGTPGLAEVVKRFGPQVLNERGGLRREELAKMVFGDEQARRDLEAILHPRIRAAWQDGVAKWRAEGRPVGVVVVPLLFETDAAKHFDATVCLACTPETQRQRLLARDWTEEQIRQRIAAQFSMEKKMALATYVVWTEGVIDVLARQLEEIFDF
ncbi:MAG: dephospho-CoA kinase [Verrucomicrobiota bacterium]